MKAISKIMFGGAAIAALVSAVPAAAQYPYGNGYGNNGAGVVGQIINSVIGYGQYPYGNYGYGQQNYASSQVAVNQCARAAEARIGGGGYGGGGYGSQGGHNGYGAQETIMSPAAATPTADTNQQAFDANAAQAWIAYYQQNPEADPYAAYGGYAAYLALQQQQYAAYYGQTGAQTGYGQTQSPAPGAGAAAPPPPPPPYPPPPPPPPEYPLLPLY